MPGQDVLQDPAGGVVGQTEHTGVGGGHGHSGGGRDGGHGVLPWVVPSFGGSGASGTSSRAVSSSVNARARGPSRPPSGSIDRSTSSLTTTTARRATASPSSVRASCTARGRGDHGCARSVRPTPGHAPASTRTAPPYRCGRPVDADWAAHRRAACRTATRSTGTARGSDPAEPARDRPRHATYWRAATPESRESDPAHPHSYRITYMATMYMATILRDAGWSGLPRTAGRPTAGYGHRADASTAIDRAAHPNSPAAQQS